MFELLGGGHDDNPRRHYLVRQHTRGKYECFATRLPKQGCTASRERCLAIRRQAMLASSSWYMSHCESTTTSPARAVGVWTLIWAIRYHGQNESAVAKLCQRQAAGVNVAILQDKAVALSVIFGAESLKNKTAATYYDTRDKQYAWTGCWLSFHIKALFTIVLWSRLFDWKYTRIAGIWWLSQNLITPLIYDF